MAARIQAERHSAEVAPTLQSTFRMHKPFASFLLTASLVAPSLAHADELPTLVPMRSIPLSTESAVEPQTEWNSPALAVIGSVVAGLGIAATVTGAAFYAGDPCTGDSSGATSAFGLPQCGMGFGQAVGGVTMLGGAGLILLGTPLIVAGAWQVDSDSPGAAPTTARLEVGPARAEFAVTF